MRWWLLLAAAQDTVEGPGPRAETLELGVERETPGEQRREDKGYDQLNPQEKARVDTTKGKLLEQWQAGMEHYAAKQTLTFELGPRADEVFYEDMQEGETISGAFFGAGSQGVKDGQDGAMSLVIYAASGEQVEEQHGVEGVFLYKCKEAGKHAVHITNG